MPKPHPADAADIAMIASATSFNSHLRLSPTNKINRRTDTLADAIAAAAEMRAEHPGRDVVVYAIDDKGRQVPVPKDMQGIPAKPETTSPDKLAGKTWDKKASAQKAAHRAGLKPTAYDIEVDAAGLYSIKLRGLTGADAFEDKPADQPSKASPAKTERASTGKRAALVEAAQRGELPTVPDFSADTHKPFRKKLAAIVEMVEKGDIAGLKADTLEPKSSSRAAICRYRDLAIAALAARKAA